MASGMQVWSKTAASNSTADANVNWAEGMAPSAVNDSSRAEMASVAKWRDDNSGSLSGTLSTATYSVTSNQVAAALTAGYTIAFQLGSDIPATALLNLDTLGAKPLRPYAGTEFVGGEYKANSIIRATYFTSNSGEWLVHAPRYLGATEAAIATANIQASAVTYAKIQNVTTNMLLGNVSGSGAAPEEITIGGGLAVSGTTLSAPAFPPSGSFKNLSIKVASTTTVTVAADLVTTTDGTNYKTTAVSGTVNLGTNGAANTLDTGTIAIDTWYAIWVIAKTDGTTAALASTSATSPTMPTGYTFKARVGWVRTIHGSATLFGTWQLGRRVQYVVGLAQTTSMISLISGSSGSTSVPTWTSQSVSSVVPTTASEIIVSLNAYGSAAAAAMAAPNGSYGAITSSSNPPPLQLNNGSGSQNFSVMGTFVLESSNIFYASNNSSTALYCLGWVDNI